MVAYPYPFHLPINIKWFYTMTNNPSQRNLIVYIFTAKEILAQWILVCKQGNATHKNSSLSEMHLPTVLI